MTPLEKAIRARREARKMRPGNPLGYAAYRNVSYFESQLSDEDFEAYQRWANGGGK